MSNGIRINQNQREDESKPNTKKDQAKPNKGKINSIKIE
jgi:hypothetical protein